MRKQECSTVFSIAAKPHKLRVAKMTTDYDNYIVTGGLIPGSVAVLRVKTSLQYSELALGTGEK